MMKLIVAVDQHWGIGDKGELLELIPPDMKHFKEKTMGKVVVMGKGTFESLPGRKPLQDRMNIVVTKSVQQNCEGIIVCSSLAELFSLLSGYNNDDIFIIGGESIYKQCMQYCSEAYITKIEKEYRADKYFSDLDNHPKWKCVEDGCLQTYKDIAFKFTVYKNLDQAEWRIPECRKVNHMAVAKP
jgi:dihydrofolate reductase